MRIDVEITNKVTGEKRIYDYGDYPDAHMGEPDDPFHYITFMFDEGNYGCDCNRALFFGRAAGVELGDNDTPCGDERYSVRVTNQETGEEIYADGCAGKIHAPVGIRK